METLYFEAAFASLNIIYENNNNNQSCKQLNEKYFLSKILSHVCKFSKFFQKNNLRGRDPVSDLVKWSVKDLRGVIFDMLYSFHSAILCKKPLLTKFLSTFGVWVSSLCDVLRT